MAVENTAARRLGEFCGVQTGPFGSQLHAEDYVDNGTPIITVEHLGDNEVLHANLPLVSETDRVRLSRYSLREGDIVFSRVGAIDRTAFIGSKEDGWLFSGRLLRVRPNSSVADGRYLSYMLGHEDAVAWIRNHSVGSTMACLNTAIMSGVPLRIPSLPVQRRIAAILDTLDDAIHRTEQVIAKVQQMKQGLLHDLLTRGVDEHGDLRPPPSEAQHLYKDSPLGRIPKEWKVMRVEETLAVLLDFRGKTPKKLGMEWGGGDIPALSAKNVRIGRIDLEEETYYGSTRLYEKWMTKGDPVQGDVVLTTEAPLGNVAQIPDGRRYFLSQRVVLLRFNGSMALSHFMAVQLANERFQSNLKQWSTGTTATGIQMAKMALVPVVLPPLAEQALQAETAQAVVRRMDTELSLLRKFRDTKSGLLHDLLTGRIRVPIAEEV